MKNKLISRKNLGKIIEGLKKKNKKIVFTNGCFDLLHHGHISYLNKAKRIGDILIVGLNSDKSVRNLKGRGRPILNIKDRLSVLSSLEMIDYITVFNEDTPVETIKNIKPHYHVKGGDYTLEDLKEREIVESFGGRVRIVPFVKGKSTTNIIKKIKKI